MGSPKTLVSRLSKTLSDDEILCSSGNQYKAGKNNNNVLMPEGQALFSAVYQQAVSLGLTQKQLRRLPHIQAIRKARWNSLWRTAIQLLAIFIFALAIVSVSWTLDWPIPKDKMAKTWWHFRGEKPTSRFVESKSCLIRASDLVQDMARPPISCDFCRDVKAVVRVRAISQEEFVEHYAYSGHPLIVEDGASNWTAVNTFNFDYFKGIYAPDSRTLENMDAQCQFFPYKTDFANLGEVFDMGDDRAKLKDGSKPWYIGWSNCDATAGDELRTHYTRPYFLPDNSESSNTDWIFMGSPGYGAHMHVDNVRFPSWQAQITGIKLWTLQPPTECYGQCESTLTATIHPGEIFVIDTNKWFHSTLNVGDDISITIGSEFD